ncbi:lactoylglutathione lyase [Fusarium mundagurra]|uniref:lactoylglutathione lyase n=1 Tax=Fusarium mundagurra TaxID=1567541 RepID=A0A8H6DP93_9HYPO|nr:lactoylglutathione lyase [Fusarium mundagurra]
MASTTDTKNYKFNHSMIRVKDPKASGKSDTLMSTALIIKPHLKLKLNKLTTCANIDPNAAKFYEFLGMSLVKKLEFPDSKFDLYFFGYDSPNALSHNKSTFDRQGLIELTHNYGTEDDPEYKVNNGNQEPNRGFGHTCIAVDNIQAACKRIEDAGYKFQKKLTDGRMRNIAFVLDPDGYWVEVVARNDYKQTEDVKETDVSTYTMNHTMLRVKDAEKSLKYYQEVLGMSRLRTLENPEAGFNLYFLGYPGDQPFPEGQDENTVTHREGLLELTWNYGTEKDENFHYHDGNSQPQGFGHICVSVDNIDAACKRFEDLNVSWKKRLTDGRMKNVAFLLDPDGYWIELVQNEKFSGKENF